MTSGWMNGKIAWYGFVESVRTSFCQRRMTRINSSWLTLTRSLSRSRGESWWASEVSTARKVASGPI